MLIFDILIIDILLAVSPVKICKTTKFKHIFQFIFRIIIAIITKEQSLISSKYMMCNDIQNIHSFHNDFCLGLRAGC